MESLLLEAGHLHIVAVVVLRLVPPQRVADAVEETQVGEHDAVRLLQLLHHLFRVQRLVQLLGGGHVHADSVATEDDARDVRRGVELEPLLLQPAMFHDARDVATVVDEKRLLPDRILVDAAVEEGVDAGTVSIMVENTYTRSRSLQESIPRMRLISMMKADWWRTSAEELFSCCSFSSVFLLLVMQSSIFRWIASLSPYN